METYGTWDEEWKAGEESEPLKKHGTWMNMGEEFGMGGQLLHGELWRNHETSPWGLRVNGYYRIILDDNDLTKEHVHFF